MFCLICCYQRKVVSCWRIRFVCCVYFIFASYTLYANVENKLYANKIFSLSLKFLGNVTPSIRLYTTENVKTWIEIHLQCYFRFVCYIFFPLYFILLYFYFYCWLFNPFVEESSRARYSFFFSFWQNNPNSKISQNFFITFHKYITIVMNMVHRWKKNWQFSLMKIIQYFFFHIDDFTILTSESHTLSNSILFFLLLSRFSTLSPIFYFFFFGQTISLTNLIFKYIDILYFSTISQLEYTLLFLHIDIFIEFCFSIGLFLFLLFCMALNSKYCMKLT